ncbi:hypothetical protein [Acinetobacter baylyi]|uniref:Uncharacterized protein n=2 Tax=Acinetobacter baylyi TaxID=202950 RepID=Q6F7N2_ACIAD|nr:hypothetical protein [Acinetobacter baylyi]ENV55090.1 hypothetical protein F952_00812 [Acinetobacter baylyi DSM 14961 = CIP 107474]KAF2371232.1 hypothetical protein BSL88_08345 [Acinetobacter baylyi]KAF2374559.1 hypothetical protein BSL67_04445 [Acinetobacter baylyi]KAF2375618.1 hypothetical protein BSN81_16315 [Acinetobacter baylyi]KAF2379851.1 hypothetical protein BSN83_12850 [Acinetobacter baylyi]
MFHILDHHRGMLFWIILSVLVVSSIITLEFENIYSDGISISVNVLAGFGLFMLMIKFVVEELESICNP